MSHFFRAASATDPSLVARQNHNSVKGFAAFADASSTDTPEPQALASILVKSEQLQHELEERMRPPPPVPLRSNAHLHDGNIKLVGRHLQGGSKCAVESTVPEVRREHVIDKLQRTLRHEILSDLQDDVRRKILAQESFW